MADSDFFREWFYRDPIGHGHASRKGREVARKNREQKKFFKNWSAFLSALVSGWEEYWALQWERYKKGEIGLNKNPDGDEIITDNRIKSKKRGKKSSKDQLALPV